MGYLKKIRSNILNQQNSFHIGFGNRSPFNYKSQYSGDWTAEVPMLTQNPSGWVDPNIGGEWSKATIAAIKAVGDIGTAVTTNLLSTEKNDSEKNGSPKSDPMKPKVDVEKNPIGNAKGQVKPGSIAHQHLDPEGYDAWAKGKELLKKEKEEEAKEAKRKWELENAGVPDFTNFTGTSSDWH
jgi:hypothetical protein